MRFSVEQLASRLNSLCHDVNEVGSGTADQLNRQNQGSLPKVILLNGNEPLLVEEALDQTRAVLKAQGFSERIKYQVETGFDWSTLTRVGMEMSLFAEQRVIELRVPKTLGQAGSRVMLEYCDNLPEQDVLLMIMPYLDKRQRQAKWAKAIDAAGWIVDSHEISAQQFPNWLKQRLQSRSLRVESGVIELLSQRLEGNILAAAQEIDKLQVLASGGAVTLSLVNDSLADQARFDVYALTDVCLLGHFDRALRIKGRLKSEGLEPVIVVWALVREIRLLTQLAEGLSRGHNKQALFKQQRIWSKREPAVNAALQRHHLTVWYQLLDRAGHLDQTVKGQRYQEAGSVWYQIEQLCAALCGVQVLHNKTA